jgi:hypothetical protein
VLGEGEIVRRFDAPVSIHAMAKPVGYATGKEGGVATASGLGVIALDTHLLELGLGAGAVTLEGRGTTESVAIAQLARIGARDGVAFDTRSTIVVVNDKFKFGSFDGSLQFPLAPRWLMLMRGGGGVQGYVYGDAGAKYRLTETRGEGAISVSGALGVTGIRGQDACTSQAGYVQCSSLDYVGPAIRFGVEWRL